MVRFSSEQSHLFEFTANSFIFRTLYELKDNVVTINSDQCTHLSELQKCIDVSSMVTNIREVPFDDFRLTFPASIFTFITQCSTRRPVDQRYDSAN